MKKIQTDVVVVGSSPAGLAAAIVARAAGLEVICVEAGSWVGGATARSEGLMWLPGNAAMAPAQITDSYDEARSYLQTVLGTETAASTTARRDAFIRSAPVVSRWLTSIGVPQSTVKGRPDFFPQSQVIGRTVVAKPFERADLGVWQRYVYQRDILTEFREAAPRTPKALLTMASRLAGPAAQATRGFASGGAALIARLVHQAAAVGLTIWLETPMTDLTTNSDGSVSGIIASRSNGNLQIATNVGVIMASGGFENNPELRQKYLPNPTDVTWTVGNPENKGIAIKAAATVGAAIATMDRAWWTPIMLIDGVAAEVEEARCLPSSMIVDANGYRFMNEAAPQPVIGRQMYERNRSGQSVPSFLVLDNRHRSQYGLGPWLPGSTPRRAIEDGEVVKAASINDLADKLGIDQAGLIGTVVRFNGFAKKGQDLDFKRGETPHDRFFGDSGKRKNPCLGLIAKAPFWGIRIYPGDFGTKGGILVNEFGQAVRDDGEIVRGLYACGGAAASSMKNTAPATGTRLSIGLIEGFRAGATAAGTLDELMADHGASQPD